MEQYLKGTGCEHFKSDERQECTEKINIMNIKLDKWTPNHILVQKRKTGNQTER